jgi:hypothetical protein
MVVKGDGGADNGDEIFDVVELKFTIVRRQDITAASFTLGLAT